MLKESLKKGFPHFYAQVNSEDRITTEHIEKLAKYNIVTLGSQEIDDGKKRAESEPVRRIKSVNPRTIVLCYLNVFDLEQSSPNLYEIRTKHPDWLLRDRQGNPCRAYNQTEKYKSGTRWIMDPRSDWKKFYAQKALEITEAGYDGIFADNTWGKYNTGDAKVKYSYLELDMTVEEWQNAWAGFLGYVKEQLGDKLLIDNGAPVKKYLENSDGCMIESFMRLDIKDFEEEMDKARLITKMGKILINHSYYANEMITRTNLFRWYYTCSLLTDGYFCYATTFDYWHPEYEIKLGKAKGEYYKKDSVYQRDFEGGKVMVNPTLKDFRVKLEDEFKLWGKKRVREVDLPAYSGVLLQAL